jgi:hypothetical protein
MKLVYKKQEIPVTTTTNPNLMRFKFQKLYYAIIINNCNRYSSIASKQRIDIAMTDNNLNILSFKHGMHENTVYENKQATKTILLPLNTFTNLEENTSFTIK